jgi:hypothetical protein
MMMTESASSVREERRRLMTRWSFYFQRLLAVESVIAEGIRVEPSTYP